MNRRRGFPGPVFHIGCCAAVVLAAACSGSGSSSSSSQVTSTPRPVARGVALGTVATGLDSPLDVVAIPGSTDLAIVEKTGRVVVLKHGRVAQTPLLDLRGHVSQGAEQGLLSIAFSPHFAEDSLAYVDYTDPSGDVHVAQLDTRSRRLRTILLVHHPLTNHNGGALAFGPDGLLYVGIGDGGGEGDPEGNGQNRSSLLGKILRLDVSQPHPAAQMYAYGLRNPWRFSFDRTTGDLWIGDVGQNRFEEVDDLAAGTPAGANLGWNAFEGRAVYKRQKIDRSRLVGPVAVYPHRLGCSITGGFVYRGNAVPALRGRYVYGDYCSGRIWTLDAGGGQPHLLDLPRVQQLSSFGEDSNGELYVTSLDGRVLRFVASP
jgi:glucose/arabinose dehydrogenase